MKFRTILDREVIATPSGSRMVNEYQLIPGKENAHAKLTVVGQFDQNEKIQSYRDSCDIKKILNRYMATGDEELLNRRKAYYLDTVGLPKDNFEWLQLYKASVQMFDSLPADAKNDFKNNPDEFFASIGTEKFNKYFIKEDPVKEVVPDSETKVGDLVE